MPRLLIALDVDGTTVRHDGRTISPRVRAAVRAVHAAGHHVVLSTGRSPAATLPVAAALGLAGGFAVCSNGAVTLRMDVSVCDRYTVVAQAGFDARAVLVAVARLWPGCAVAVEVPGGLGFRATASFPCGQLPDVLVVPWDELGAQGASRLLVRAAGDPALLAQVAGQLELDCIQDTTGAPDAMEIGPRGVSKATALESLRTDLGVAPVDTVAVGDHVNDLEMLRWAARGVAMGHAPAVVRAAADEVAPSCEDDGLGAVLEALAPAMAAPARPSVPGQDRRPPPEDRLWQTGEGRRSSRSIVPECR